MRLKQKAIGNKIYKKGFGVIVIDNDESKFELYKSLELDVFVKERKKAKKEDIDSTKEK